MLLLPRGDGVFRSLIVTRCHGPHPNKVDTIHCMNLLTSLRNFKVFPGNFRILPSIFPHFAELAGSLVPLLKNDVDFALGDKNSAAFSALCEALASSPFLFLHNFKIPFILFTDTRNMDIRAILSKRDLNVADHPMAYCSKTMS